MLFTRYAQSVSSLCIGNIQGETHAPYPTQLLPRPRFENMYVESMAYTMRSRRNTSESRSNNRNFRSAELSSRLRWCRGEKFVQKPLEKLVEKDEGEEDWVLHFVRIWKLGMTDKHGQLNVHSESNKEEKETALF